MAAFTSSILPPKIYVYPIQSKIMLLCEKSVMSVLKVQFNRSEEEHYKPSTLPANPKRHL